MATFTYESIKNRFKNPTVDGNLDLLDDGAIIKVGADDDLQITHSGSAATITQGTGDTTLDLAGDLIIDVDGGDILLKDAGTQFGGFSNSSGHLVLKDGTTTFLTANGNDATFADTLAVTGVLTADAGVNIDNITIDGTEIDLSSGDLTIDVAGNIILDAGGDNITLKDDGTQFGQFVNTGSNLIIKSGTTTAATFSGANTTLAGTLASGAITSSGDVTAFSDMRLKSDIRTIDNALNRVCDLRGVFFTKDNEAGTGVIAQEVENILPEVVHSGVYKSVAYGNMVGVLIEAIKELRSQVKSLQESS
jgi:hypothetical protein